MVGDRSVPADARIHALWSLAALGDDAVQPADCDLLLAEENPNLRREGARFHPAPTAPELAGESDHFVRAQLIRTLRDLPPDSPEAVPALLRLVPPEATMVTDAAGREQPWGGRHGKVLPAGGPYESAFERYLVRTALESRQDALLTLLDGEVPADLTGDQLLFATLALPEAERLPRFLRAFARLERRPSEEELLTLVEASGRPGAKPVIAELLSDPEDAKPLLYSLLALRDRIDREKATAWIEAGAVPALKEGTDPELATLGVRLLESFKSPALVEPVFGLVTNEKSGAAIRVDALRALAASGATWDADQLAPVLALARDHDSHEVRAAATELWAQSPELWKAENGAVALAGLDPEPRQGLIDRLAGSARGAQAILAATESGALKATDIGPAALEKMRVLLPKNPAMDALWTAAAASFPRALVLGGKATDFSATGIDLKGPFTVETWFRLQGKIGNSDGILGRPGGADFNFFNGSLHVYMGPKNGDALQSKRPIVPGSWTHLAITRDADGKFRSYFNGELDAEGGKAFKGDLTGLNIGQTTPGDAGTEGEIAEFRVWDRARSAEEIAANFDRALPPDSDGLVTQFPGAGPWPGRGEGSPVAEGPPVLDAEAAAALEERMAHFRALHAKPGDAEAGKALFAGLCLSCHTLDGKGGGLAPALDGSAHREVNGLLRALLTPDAAVEPGYRAFRIETHDNRLVEGFLVSDDPKGITLRMMGGAEQRIPRNEIARAKWTNRSLMVPGLLDALSEEQVADLFAYIKTLN